MKKFLGLLFIICLLTACAGAPPQWWNPSGTYGNESVSSPQQSTSARVSPAVRPEEMPVPVEESISTQDDSYEEMILTPLQDEETEEPSAGAQTQNTMDITPSAPESATAGSALPLPSVLSE